VNIHVELLFFKSISSPVCVTVKQTRGVVTGGGLLRRGKKHCRAWDYRELAVYIAAVHKSMDAPNYSSLAEDGLWGLVTSRMGLANTRDHRVMLYNAWRQNRGLLGVCYAYHPPQWSSSRFGLGR
jgi:hypothetical protein